MKKQKKTIPVVIAFSKKLLNKILLKKDAFAKLLKSNKSSSEISEVSGLSIRTIQKIRKQYSLVKDKILPVSKKKLIKNK